MRTTPKTAGYFLSGPFGNYMTLDISASSRPMRVVYHADAGFEGLTASRLVEFRIHGVTGEFVDEMTGLGIEGLTSGRLVEMRIHGVSVDFARRAQASRGNDLTAGDLVEIRIHGTRLD